MPAASTASTSEGEALRPQPRPGGLRAHRWSARAGAHNRGMSPLLQAALHEARTLGAERGWSAPDDAAVQEAQRLLELVATALRPPAVEVEPDGSISLAWESGAHGWLELLVQGRSTVTHSAVIE